jgi:hypothetical protein
MFKRKGIKIKNGQRWTIGKGTQKLFFNNHGVKIGNEVEIIQWLGNGGFINVRCTETNERFDVKPQNLGSLTKEAI